jgi:hypothetical protein
VLLWIAKALYLFTSESSARRTFGINLASSVQKLGNEIVIMKSTDPGQLKRQFLYTSSEHARWITLVDGQGAGIGCAAPTLERLDALRQTTLDKAKARSRSMSGPWPWP